eukprot:SAG31_NODE_1464_length_8235_cov_12.023968_4_plen_55_part_00
MRSDKSTRMNVKLMLEAAAMHAANDDAHLLSCLLEVQEVLDAWTWPAASFAYEM